MLYMHIYYILSILHITVQINDTFKSYIIYCYFATRFIHLHKLILRLTIDLILCPMLRLNVSAMIYIGGKGVGDIIDVTFIIDTMFTE